MIYSNLKAIHHRDRIEELRQGRLIMPTQVQIDLTNLCNHRCPYCFYRCARTETLNALFNEDDVFEYARFCALIKEFSKLGIGAVQYTGGGEPFMHLKIYEILEMTVASGIEFSIVTNGGLLDEKRIDLLKHASWIRFSLDAATSATHMKSQKPKHPEFFQILSKIKHIAKSCPDVIIGISFVANPINYKELLSAAEWAKSLGAHNIRLSVAYTPRGADLYRGIWPSIEEQARQAKKKFEDKNFKVFNLIASHLENLDLKQKGYSFCGYQHFTAVLGADMELYPCCTLKYNPLGKLGNLKDKTFFELWTGGARAGWLKRDHLKLVCDKNPCWMDGKNQFLSYLVEPDPPHINFI